MPQVTQGTSTNWKEIINSEIPVVVEFYTPSCPYCRTLTPIFQKLSDEYVDKLNFVMVDASVEGDIASGFGIMGVPTIKFFCSGRPIGEIVGFKPENELKTTFDEIIKNYSKCVSESSPLYG